MLKSILSLVAYRLLFLLLLPVLLLVLLIRSKNQPAYRQRLTERLGFVPTKFKAGGIVIHAASVGEVIAIKSFVQQLIALHPEETITITTFTPTGSEQVGKLFGDQVQHCYFPLDIYCCTWLFLKRLQPKALVVMETELWPNIVAQAKRQQIKLLLINARLSKKSLPRYQKLTPLITPCLQQFDHILCQSQVNLDAYLALGADSNKCSISGNLKFDISHNPDTESKAKDLATYLQAGRDIWLVASTHDGDEALALTSFKSLQAQHPSLLLCIVPRHPERFEQVANLVEQHQFILARRSTRDQVNADCQVWLLDTLGELMAAYSLATVVTIGGSFSKIGGHNPLEPALYKKPIIVGPDMSNFSEVFQQLQQNQAISQLDNTKLSEQLSKQVNELLSNPEQAEQLGQQAFAVVLANQGASGKSLVKLNQLISG